jgi:hypothetical protein
VGTVDRRLGKISERFEDLELLLTSVSSWTIAGLVVEFSGVGTASRSPTVAVRTRFPRTHTVRKVLDSTSTAGMLLGRAKDSVWSCEDLLWAPQIVRLWVLPWRLWMPAISIRDVTLSPAISFLVGATVHWHNHTLDGGEWLRCHN